MKWSYDEWKCEEPEWMDQDYPQPTSQRLYPMVCMDCKRHYRLTFVEGSTGLCQACWEKMEAEDCDR